MEESYETVKYVHHHEVLCFPYVVGHIRIGENPARVTQRV